MSILDKVKIGNSVQVNLELSKDRLTQETIDAINISSLGKISDFRITDGKGIGVVLELSNGKEQWFFEDEIDLLDENGNVIKKNNDKKENSNFIFDFLRSLNYENKNKVSELLNPINFFIWLVVSFKDIF
ncbi:cytochrome b6f subunit family protein [uncultured Prochlorococcus sp.]|uniref:cytochrome b6-f complex subunit PetP n=1 Tax=uncultured Prochlorococcus sp. TaxID=159733 RepID=UPI00258E71BC|nr:cytochrome b6f subunit family protein [uncultured Prochlorococcus sp.]